MDASLRPRPATANATKTVATTRPDDARTAARWDAVMRRVQQAQQGSRNAWLFWAATKLRELPVDPATRDRLASDLEDAGVDRGLPRTEAKASVASGLSEPRGVSA
jgi:hypothetical protein